MATSATRGRSSAISSRRMAGPMRTPSRPVKLCHCCGLAFSSASGRMTDGAPSDDSSPKYFHSSCTISRCRRSLRIHALLERLHAHAAERVDERFFFAALLTIDLDDARDGLGDVALPHRRADDL